MGALQVPETIQNCNKCTNSCNKESLKCTQCRKYIHAICSQLPVYQLIQYYKSGCKYVCSGCVQNNYIAEYETLSQFIESLNSTGVSSEETSQSTPSTTQSPDPPIDVITINTENRFQILNDSVELNSNEPQNVSLQNSSLNSPDLSFTSTSSSDYIECGQRVNHITSPKVPHSQTLSQLLPTLTPESQHQPLYNAVEINSDSKKKDILCRFFRQNVCKHGRDGINCLYYHPQICEKYKNYGPYKTKGCNKGDSCELFHPFLCKTSVENSNCFDRKCRNMHLLKTKRIRDICTDDEEYKRSNRQNEQNSLDKRFLDINTKISDMQHNVLDSVDTRF